MMLPQTLLLNAGGLFDFDLTFAAEAILFLLLAFVVTFVFLKPVSTTLTERAKSIQRDVNKSILYTTSGYYTSLSLVFLFTQELRELLRQLKKTKELTLSSLEIETKAIQEFQSLLLKKVKATLAVQLVYMLNIARKEVFGLLKRPIV